MTNRSAGAGRDGKLRLLAALKAVTDGMDRAGGDGYGMPECPWCQCQFEDNQHNGDCELVKARELITELEAPVPDPLASSSETQGEKAKSETTTIIRALD